MPKINASAANSAVCVEKYLQSKKSTKKLLISLVLLSTIAACGGGNNTIPHSTSGSNGNGNGAGSGSPPTASPSGSYTVGGNISSVAGIDSEGRGYRDDVKQLISDEFGSNPVLTSIAQDVAKSYQISLTLDLNSVSTTQQYLQNDAVQGACAVDKAGPANGASVQKVLMDVYARTFNTPDRLNRRQEFVNKAPAAFSIDLPSSCPGV
jgi:hypothetical protein